jgi:hypothetical protein
VNIALARCFVSKRGERYEDAFYPRWVGERRADTLRFAVADGATQGYLGRWWGHLLARSFCKADSLALSTIAGEAASTWPRFVEAYIAERLRVGRPLRWYDERNLASGAFATLLGLILVSPQADGETGRWGAVAIGDSCLFHVRGGNLLRAFPVTRADAFTSHPNLVPSALRARQIRPLTEVTRRSVGHWRSGDVFYLMTDELAKWCLHCDEHDYQVWRKLTRLSTSEDRFAKWANTLRDSGAIRDDDMTFLRIAVIAP